MRIHLDKEKGIAVLIMKNNAELANVVTSLTQLLAGVSLGTHMPPYAYVVNTHDDAPVSPEELKRICDKVLAHGSELRGPDGQDEPR